MRQISCPVCKTKPITTPEEFSIYLCPKCQVRWTFLPKDINSDALYEDEVYAIVDNRESIFEKVIFWEAKKVLKKAEKLVSGKSKRLLDFGSGKGQFLSVAKKLSWTGIGIETAVERATFAREKYGVKVSQELYTEGVVEGGEYDLICLNHVLEHLPEPVSLVHELMDSNLKKDGIWYVEVPRANSWQAKIAGKNWIHWDIPKHLTHWTEAGIEKVFGDLGYKVVSDRTFSIHLGMLGMLQSIFSLLGYRQHLILALKKKKTLGLLAGVAFFTPLAFLLELTASLIGKSGVVGVYLKKNE